MIMKNIFKILLFSAFLFMQCIYGCKKFVEIGPPKTDLIKATVFENNSTAMAALANMYANMVSGFAGGGASSVSYLSALSGDELELYNSNLGYNEFYTNSLLPTNLQSQTGLWSSLYTVIYRSNLILEGVNNSVQITYQLKKQLEGEAKFVRAFAYFYLVNLYGDVPLVLTTNYTINANIKRSSLNLVFEQIILDLKQAENLLAADYSASKNERVRPNKLAAIALLSRVYLYEGDWVNAEQSSSQVINSPLYNLEALSNVFLKNNNEAIWQLSRDNGNAQDASTLFMSATALRPINASLKENFYQGLDNIDQRKLQWIGTRTNANGTFRYPMKYKITAATPITEYSTVLRLAEQYLIRAEARAQQNKILGTSSSESDVNAIRLRAGLGVTSANTKELILEAISNERKSELFTEWGHRWLDLKRTDKADLILGPIKGLPWNSTDVLYPIPQSEIDNNPSMVGQQNNGY
jgi:hypothetical protein